jgi:hypothetical protein
MESSRVSDFTLERYRLGELLPDDRQALEEAFAADGDIRSRLIVLDESDRELRGRYPVECLNLRSPVPAKTRLTGGGKRLLTRAAKLPARGKIAAAILLCFALPFVYYLRARNQPDVRGGSAHVSSINSAHDSNLDHNRDSNPDLDRAKGAGLSRAELSVYLKGEGETLLGDQAVLAEGNTVQLAYTAPAGEYYGVIFSIDGRSEVTMHYPYRRGQSPVLVPGRRTFLSEAYTLDDAPLYEVFVMVVSEKPLNVEDVLLEARSIAKTEDLASVDLCSDEGKKQVFGAHAVFDGCEVDTLKVLKR